MLGLLCIVCEAAMSWAGPDTDNSVLMLGGLTLDN